MASDPVQQTLDLLRGMRDMNLQANTVEITADTIRVDGIRHTDPIAKVLSESELDGHGVPG